MSDTNNPLVSVVMATYNTEYYVLREAIESVIKQTYTNWELILIDDCSTKYNDFSFIDEYHDDRIKIYHNEENLGCTKCFNIGIRLSKGKYIARLDADDISLPKRFELQVRYMEEHKLVKVLASRAVYFGDCSGANVVVPNNYECLRAYLLLHNYIHHSSVMFRKTLFEVDGLYYDESYKYAQDYDMWVRVLAMGDYFRYLPRCLIKVRIHSSQISTTERSIEQRYLGSKISRRQLNSIYTIKDEDMLLRDSLVNKYILDGVSVDAINEWVLNVLECNNTTKVYDQHYLKLAFARRYIPFIVRNKSFKCLVFVFHNMGIECWQMILIQIYRCFLGLKYSLLYGRS